MASLRLAWLLACLLVLASSAQAERPALKSYTTADGLAHNQIESGRGVYWIATNAG